MRKAILLTLAVVLAGSVFMAQQAAPGSSAYQPKFAGDKAHSNAEAGALGYMRTVVAAQKVYKKKHNTYAKSLTDLVGSQSFTKRMTATDRGEYTVNFKAKTEKDKTDGYSLALTPKQFDPDHRAFYVDESGVFRGETDKAANSSSPVLE